MPTAPDVPGSRSSASQVSNPEAGSKLSQIHLKQPEDSILNKMFQSMKKNPTKGDWASSSTALIDKFELHLTIQEIKEAKPGVFKALVKKQMFKIALRDLLERN